MTPFEPPISDINTHAPPNSPQIYTGASFTSIALNTPYYLLNLLSQARNLGATVIQTRIPVEGRLPGALTFVERLVTKHNRPSIDVYVNATGLGAAKLCNDEAMFPIRGQTVLVKGEAEAIRARSGNEYGAYCIPRPGSGTTILGGTREAGVWSEKVDDNTTKKILERCSPFAPELLTGQDGGFEVISAQVGLRPGRKGGPRMEVENVDGKPVVHAYGHAGAG